MTHVLLTDMGEELEKKCKKCFSDFIVRRIKKAMDEKNMSAEDLAVKARINKVTLSRYLSGNGMPTVYNMYKIAIVLDKTIDYFF